MYFLGGLVLPRTPNLDPFFDTASQFLYQKMDETAVPDCNPALSVLVVLMSRKVTFSRSISIAILL